MEPDDNNQQAPEQFSPADIGALAHLYRGEMYQSKIWRGRLDATTNWAVVVTGIALSATFSHPDASPIPMLLGSWLVVAFLAFSRAATSTTTSFASASASWRSTSTARSCAARASAPTTAGTSYSPTTTGPCGFTSATWRPSAGGFRRNYGWLFGTQLVCYVGKLIVHPTALVSLDQLWQRAAIGPIPGNVAVGIGVVFHLSWIAVALFTLRTQRAVGLPKRRKGPDQLLVVARDV